MGAQGEEVKQELRTANKEEAQECIKIQQLLIANGINNFDINSVMAVFAHWICDVYIGNGVTKQNLQQYISKVYDKVIEDAKVPQKE